MTEPPAPSRRDLLSRMALAGAAPLVAAAPAQAQLVPFVMGAVRADGAVSVLDFMAPEQIQRCRDRMLSDCTAAFAQAQKASLLVIVPPGRYGLRGLRIVNGAVLAGAGRSAVILEQLGADEPAIHCLSDRDSGQLLGVELSGVTVRGHAQARVAAVLVAAFGAYAVTRSHFDYFAKNTFRALEVQGPDAYNVYNCRFHVVSEGTSGTAVLVNGAVYNRYDLFLTECATIALEDQSHGSEIRVVSDNCLLFTGQRNRVALQLEEIFSPRPGSPIAVEDRGFGNTYDTPTVVLMGANAQRLTHALKAFSQTVYLNPQIIAAPGNRLHPFAPTRLPFTVMGGRSSAGRKLEAEFNGADDTRLPRTVTFIGDARDFING